MQAWEYCEVAYTPKQVIVHVYSSRDDGTYEGFQTPEEWGALLTQLGGEGWEMVGVITTKPTTHALYYFKRPIDAPAHEDWKERQAKFAAPRKNLMAQVDTQKPQQATQDSEEVR
jgi:hypothetical protein